MLHFFRIFIFFKPFSYKKFIFLYFFALFFGFLSTYLNQNFFNYHEKITGKIFVDVKGKVEDFKEFQNSKTLKNGLFLTISEPVFSKSQFVSKNSQKPKKERKISDNYVLKNFVNIKNYSDIDLQFLKEKNNYQDVKWVEKNGEFFYENPPKKITVFSHDTPKINVNDEIFFKSSLLPLRKKDFVGGFDFEKNSHVKNIGATGYVSGKITILKEEKISSIDNFFQKMRKKIKQKILIQNNHEGAISLALLTGDRGEISENEMNNIRNSGLAHLMAISGLHLSLAAAIFFFTSNFFLSQSQYLMLNFNIKKISAIFAIIGAYFYLKIAGSPIPATRAFIAVFFVMLAILLDKKIDSLRLVIFALFLVILLNPYNIFSISFQLSFAAISSLIALNELISKKNYEEENLYKKFLKYFVMLILMSLCAQIATAPFLIYHFKNLAIYGILTNIIAIPIASFITMPFGFLSLFLMPFGLEKHCLIAMNHSISAILKSADFVANLKYSNFYLPQIPEYGLIMAILGLTLFVIFKNKIKFVGILFFVLSFFTIQATKSPQIIIDENASFFAFYDENGLVFSKKHAKMTKKLQNYLKNLNEEKYQDFLSFDDEKKSQKGIKCDEILCEIDLGRYFVNNENARDKNMLLIFKRAPVSRLCVVGKKFDIVINLTKKYEIPVCLKNQNIIDNLDLLDKGVHFIYIDKKITIKTAN